MGGPFQKRELRAPILLLQADCRRIRVGGAS